MAMPFITVPDFPDVPDLPGVPALVRQLGTPVLSSINGLLNDAGLGQFSLGFAPTVWGIFDDDGNAVAIADSVIDFGLADDSRVSYYPQEEGAFASYNKVATPYESHVRLARGGSEDDRGEFLDAIASAKESTDLYSIITPEITYLNANIVRYDYRREQRNGATLLMVDITLLEIRIAAPAQFANVENPASSDAVSQGQVQPVTVSSGSAALYGPMAGIL